MPCSLVPIGCDTPDPATLAQVMRAAVLALIWLVPAGLAFWLSGRKGYSMLEWAVLGVLLGPFALFAVLVAPRKKEDAMRGRRLLVAALAVGAALSVLTAAEPCAAGNCGLVPMKPLTPLGCRDLTPVCVCDSSGMNCHWQWVCVR